MILTIELTDTEYIATMDALTEAIIQGGGFRNRATHQRSIHALELEHLRTLLAEAAVLCPRCNLPTAVCNETNRIVNKALDMLEDTE